MNDTAIKSHLQRQKLSCVLSILLTCARYVSSYLSYIPLITGASGVLIGSSVNGGVELNQGGCLFQSHSSAGLNNRSEEDWKSSFWCSSCTGHGVII